MNFQFQNSIFSEHKIIDYKDLNRVSFFVIKGPRGGEYGLMSYLDNPKLFYAVRIRSIGFTDCSIKGFSKFKLEENFLVETK